MNTINRNLANSVIALAVNDTTDAELLASDKATYRAALEDFQAATGVKIGYMSLLMRVTDALEGDASYDVRHEILLLLARC